MKFTIKKNYKCIATKAYNNGCGTHAGDAEEIERHLNEAKDCNGVVKGKRVNRYGIEVVLLSTCKYIYAECLKEVKKCKKLSKWEIARRTRDGDFRPKCVQVGDKFITVEGNAYISKGTAVELVYDDGSACLKFRNLTNGNEVYINLFRLKRLKEKFISRKKAQKLYDRGFAVDGKKLGDWERCMNCSPDAQYWEGVFRVASPELKVVNSDSKEYYSNYYIK
jgi:hypothetical protein